MRHAMQRGVVNVAEFCPASGYYVFLDINNDMGVKALGELGPFDFVVMTGVMGLKW